MGYTTTCFCPVYWTSSGCLQLIDQLYNKHRGLLWGERDLILQHWETWLCIVLDKCWNKQCVSRCPTKNYVLWTKYNLRSLRCKLQVVQLDSCDRQESFLSFITSINWCSKNINSKVLTLSFFVFCPKLTYLLTYLLHGVQSFLRS